MENTQLLSILVITSLVLLLIVSGGILYLTSIEWRDRRKQQEAKRLK